MSQDYDYDDYADYEYDYGGGGSGEMGAMTREQSNQFAPQPVRPQYQSMTEHQTVERVIGIARELGSQIGYEQAEAECLALLSITEFDMYKASQLPFEGGSKELETIANGDSNEKSYSVPWGDANRGRLLPNLAATECYTCFLDLAPGEGRAFCRHTLCKDCWKSKLNVHRTEWNQRKLVFRCDDSKNPPCLGMAVLARLEPDLTTFLGPSFVDDYFPKHRHQWCSLLTEISRYPTKTTLEVKNTDGKARKFAFDHVRFVRCGIDDCNCVFEVERSLYSGTDHLESVVGKCGDCNKRTCFLCHCKEHSPASCAAMSMWKEKESDEGLNAAWVLVHTKACPGCQSMIEKNEGCNHMTCRKCRHEFCWICMGKWSDHGTSYYNCNKPTKANKELASAVESARSSLQRYTHYYNRYQNHMNSVKLDEKTIEAVRAYVNSNFDGGNITYLEDVAKTLFDCRYTLANTYIYAYFVEGNSDIFEYNQGRLEHATEELSRIVETCKRGGEIGKSQLEVQNKASVAKRYLEVLRKGI